MTVNIDQFVVSAPGKVILFGEHAAVYNKPAIAAAIALRTYMLVVPSQGADAANLVLEFPSINLRFSYPVADLPWDAVKPQNKAARITNPAAIPTELDEAVLKALEPLLKDLKNSFQHVAVLAFFYLYLHLCTPDMPARTFVTQSTLPVGAGLGSSATFAVCLSSALLLLSSQLPTPRAQRVSADLAASDQASPEHDHINGWAFIGEKCLHGNPSGIDNTVACRGGAVLFQRPNTLVPIREFPELKLLLTNTKHPRRTADLVARVGDLVRTFSKGTMSILDAIEHVTQEAFELLAPTKKPAANTTSVQGVTLRAESSPDEAAKRLIELVRINHGLLVSLGVSHPKLEKIRAVGDELGIGETKLTGAGGGGCAITLLHVDAENAAEQEAKLGEFHARLVNDKVGFEIFDTILGGPGVGYGELAQPITVSEFHKYNRAQLEGISAWQYWK
ncbi:hypothetical protein D0Z00_001522 [Geotrichum galactomycetum]|uniref:Uncharacterized protein n=1 Tax=Geotrichum galactomycetum TaxID=27317 RepID=A0ACB6V6U2_9ASCO|nr:hypothetical protein D0Z00_001522 [Geotrichum candidum]